MRKLHIPVLEPDGHGGARVRTGRKPRGPRVHTKGEDVVRLASEPWRAVGYGHVYRQARQLCMERANGQCERCGRIVAVKTPKGWRSTTGQTHHAVPLRDGGTCNPSGMVLLCPSCHRIVEDGERKRRNCER